MTIYLTAEQILLLPYGRVSETGSEHDLRSLGLLEAAAVRPRRTFDNEELNPEFFIKVLR